MTCELVHIKSIQRDNDENIIGGVFFTDVKASSILWGFSSSKEWQKFIYKSIDIHYGIINKLLELFNMENEGRGGGKGLIIKTAGDSAMIFCPYSVESCIQFALCLQYNMYSLNDRMVKYVAKVFGESKVKQLYSSIPSPKLGSNDKPSIFSIRIGFCYGDYMKIRTGVQCREFIDVFGPGVNLASRMESKMSTYPGAIAITYYFNNGENIRDIPDAISDKLKKVVGYNGYVFPTNSNNKVFRSLTHPKDIDLHGALPINTNIFIYLLVPESYTITNLKFLTKADTEIAHNNFLILTSTPSSPLTSVSPVKRKTYSPIVFRGHHT